VAVDRQERLENLPEKDVLNLYIAGSKYFSDEAGTCAAMQLFISRPAEVLSTRLCSLLRAFSQVAASWQRWQQQFTAATAHSYGPASSIEARAVLQLAEELAHGVEQMLRRAVSRGHLADAGPTSPRQAAGSPSRASAPDSPARQRRMSQPSATDGGTTASASSAADPARAVVGGGTEGTSPRPSLASSASRPGRVSLQRRIAAFQARHVVPPIETMGRSSTASVALSSAVAQPEASSGSVHPADPAGVAGTMPTGSVGSDLRILAELAERGQPLSGSPRTPSSALASAGITPTSAALSRGRTTVISAVDAVLRLRNDMAYFHFYRQTLQLRLVDLAPLSMAERVCFFLNVLTAMQVHAIVAMGRPLAFFDHCCNALPSYVIAGEALTADDILTTILRLPPAPSAASNPGDAGRRWTLAIAEADVPSAQASESAMLIRQLSPPRLPPTRNPSVMTLSFPPSREALHPPADAAASSDHISFQPSLLHDYLPHSWSLLLYFAPLSATRHQPVLRVYTPENLEQVRLSHCARA